MNFFSMKRIIGEMKRFNTLLTLFILLLLPLQGLAAATNSLCHQISSNSHETQANHEEGHACHQAAKQNSHSDHQKEKNHCVSACGQLNMADTNIGISAEIVEFTPSYEISSCKSYLSVLLPKFQRPPIQIS
jgi:hypothetical protein